MPTGGVLINAYETRAAAEVEQRRRRRASDPAYVRSMFGMAVDDRDLSGLEDDDDPDTRIWLKPQRRLTDDKRPEYLSPDSAPEADQHDPEREFFVDSEGEYVEPTDPTEPMHVGELWLGEGDFTFAGACKVRKPLPSDTPVVCTVCDESWPLPIDWHWREECEFDGPRAWRTTSGMEEVLDADPLLYRVTPWLWSFCRCNGCTNLKRKSGRPRKYCGPVCSAEADNAKDRARRRAKGARPRKRKETRSSNRPSYGGLISY